MKIQLFIFALIITLNIAHAATIHGTVYDLSLDAVKNAIVEVNSTPRQIYVSKDGTYLFELQPGIYLIKANLNNESFDEQEIIITKEGDFVIDLILFPAFEEDKELLEDENLSALVFKKERIVWSWIVLVILFVIIVLFILYFYKKAKKPKKEIPEDLKQVIEIIKKHGGRTTQKELKKEIPQSEAKISLMLAELEEEGIVKKIKKGRGNIIILE